MPAATLTERITLEEVQRILNETDWKDYERIDNWRSQIPICHFYDGAWAESQKRICLLWRYWLTDRRAIYPVGEEGLNEYIKELKDIVPE